MKNREIKFRVWYKKDKQMLDWFTLTQSAWNTYRRPNKLSLIYDVLVARKTDFDIMQYTGLKDKNGKEIYERDIRIAPGQSNSYLQVIEFHNTEQTCGRGWIGRNISIIDTVKWNMDKTIDIIEPIKGFSYHSLLNIGEIIGNIYENKNLI